MIAGSRCPQCERVAWPPEERCLRCRSDTEAIELAPRGSVLTYAPIDEGWAALVELEGGARRWVETDEEPTIGTTLPPDAGDRSA